MKKSYDSRTLNRNKIIKLIIAILVILLIVIMGIIYENNTAVRTFLDKYVFLKEKHENNLPKIQINSTEDLNIYAYKGNILILKNNLLTAYNLNGNEEYTLDIEISNPIFKSEGDYLCVAEKNGKKIYVISDRNIIWQKEIEANISDIAINSNGYLAVSATGTLYKTIIQTFNNKGEEQFTTYLSFTYVVDMSISPDNKNLAIAEANFSGILIQSNIKIISIEKAKKGESESIIYSDSNTQGDLIVNIKYQEKDELTCVYDNHVEVIKDGVKSTILNFEEQETLFIDLNNKIVRILKTNSQIFLQITNTNSESTKEYEISEPKGIWACENVIAINLGSEVLFYSNSGWLIKKYYASQEINKVVLSNNLAGIVYNDKIELVSL